MRSRVLDSPGGSREDRPKGGVELSLRWEVAVARLGRGKKEPSVISGAPFPPAPEHSDGPADRPRREVPTGDTADEKPAGDHAEREEEEGG